MGRFWKRVQDRWRRGRPSPVASITRLTTQKLKLTSAQLLAAGPACSPPLPVSLSIPLLYLLVLALLTRRHAKILGNPHYAHRRTLAAARPS